VVHLDEGRSAGAWEIRLSPPMSVNMRQMRVRVHLQGYLRSRYPDVKSKG